MIRSLRLCRRIYRGVAGLALCRLDISATCIRERALSWFTPYALIIASFSFLYVFVPNTRVRFVPGLIGGVFAGVLWAGGGSLFSNLDTDFRFDHLCPCGTTTWNGSS